MEAIIRVMMKETGKGMEEVKRGMREEIEKMEEELRAMKEMMKKVKERKGVRVKGEKVAAVGGGGGADG